MEKYASQMKLGCVACVFSWKSIIVAVESDELHNKHPAGVWSSCQCHSNAWSLQPVVHPTQPGLQPRSQPVTYACFFRQL